MLVIKKSLARLVHTHFIKRRTGYVFEYKLLELQPVDNNSSSIRTMQLSEDDFALLPKELREVMPDGEKKLCKGDICFVALTGNRYIHMTWVTFSTFYIDEIERAINLGPESAYVFGTFTLQEYRGRGIAASVMNTLLKQLFIRGIKKVYLIVNPENAPMLKVQKKQGGIVIGKIKFLRIWRFSSFGCQGVNNSVKQLSFLFNR